MNNNNDNINMIGFESSWLFSQPGNNAQRCEASEYNSGPSKQSVEVNRLGAGWVLSS